MQPRRILNTFFIFLTFSLLFAEVFISYPLTSNVPSIVMDPAAYLSGDADSSKADYDGPYIFYRNNSAIIKQVIKDSGNLIVKTDSLIFPIKQKHITCKVNDSVSFNTTIKDTLINETAIYDLPDKLMAISDIEGNFFPFRDFLVNNNIIDQNNQWIFGSGHLVLVGDFFDRGLNVTECLWFIYHLEQQAIMHGGYVHFILGNHEIMNLNDDIRYVRSKYPENSKLMNEDYTNLYKPDTELGRWLQTKNIAEKIGNYLFVHGGIAPELNAFNVSVDSINNTARGYYFKSKLARQTGDTLAKTIYNSKYSPFWYRGYVKEMILESDIDSTLLKFGIEKIVVGHTIVEDVRYFYNKKIIGIDTDHAEGDTEGFLYDNGEEYRIDIFGNRSSIK